MTLYVYAQPNGSRSVRGRSEGLDGFITAEHYRFKEYHASGRLGLYLKVGDFTCPHTPQDVEDSRSYSVNVKPQVQVCRRLLTVRTEWSKK